jgi:hypothetical protein
MAYAVEPSTPLRKVEYTRLVPSELSLVTNADGSVVPLQLVTLSGPPGEQIVWYAPVVIGKLGEVVEPVTYASWLESTAMAYP